MFAVFRVKRVYFLLAVLVVAQLFLTAFLCFSTIGNKSIALVDFVVVIDAGHGGVDGGVVGVSGSKESDLNLAYAKALGKAFEQRGFSVVYTRKTQGGLYGLPTKGFKMRDMQKRKQIIAESNANLVLSVHMNKYSDSSRSGPQVFFQKGSDNGQQLATSIQNALNKFTGNSHQALAGDYYVCRCANVPSVIVECGFLSNPTEEQQLLDDAYRDALVEEIFVGVMMYLYSN
jgi:N-acetylmuramoyl-L-alanine amidase